MQDLVPWPGIEPGPPALGIWTLSHWATRKSLPEVIFQPWAFLTKIKVASLHICTTKAGKSLLDDMSVSGGVWGGTPDHVSSNYQEINPFLRYQNWGLEKRSNLTQALGHGSLKNLFGGAVLYFFFNIYLFSCPESSFQLMGSLVAACAI